MRVIQHLLRRLHREERGSVVLVAIAFLPVAFGLAAFVIDVANGAEHRRHLQLQADAGALAGAQEFSGCFLDPASANADIESEALAYSGATYNPQIGSPDAQVRVVPRINAAGWEDDSYSAGEPCDTGFVDVKLVEEDSPPFFPLVGSHDFRAHARVQVFKLARSSKLLPIAVPDPDPDVAAVTFIDETTGTPLASTPLTPNGSDSGLAIWDNSAAPVTVPITAEHVGVRVALGGGSSTTCGEPLVSCYDSEPTSTNGIVHIRGWTPEGVAQAQTPIARKVDLLKGTTQGCPDAYFSGASVPCTLGVDAKVDFGSDPGALGATVAATVGNQSFPLTYSASSESWTTSQALPVAPGAGPIAVGLHWTIERTADGERCSGNSCRGDIANVQRTFSANLERSGPIKLAQISEGGLAPANVFQRCDLLFTTCSHELVVRIGIEGGLALSDTDDPPVRLRVIGGSQNQSLDCDPDVERLADELAGGCVPAYTPNTGEACPASKTDLWASAEPWRCSAVKTGNATNQVAEGLNTRILGEPKPDECPPERRNHWPDWPQGDPRIIFVMVTPFGAFSGSGSTTVPVVRFATFYVTGWTGQGGGFDNPCLDPDISPRDELPTNQAEIVGRFIQYVDTPNEGGAGEESCDFSAIDPCIAVMVE